MTTGATTSPATNQQPPTPSPPISIKPARPPASRTSASPPSPTWTPSLLTPPISISSLSSPTPRSMIQSILDTSEKALNINCINTARICLEVLSYSNRPLSAAFSTALPAHGPAPPFSTSTVASPASSTSMTLPGLQHHGLHLPSLFGIGTGPGLPLPLCSALLSRMEALCLTYQD